MMKLLLSRKAGPFCIVIALIGMMVIYASASAEGSCSDGDGECLAAFEENNNANNENKPSLSERQNQKRRTRRNVSATFLNDSPYRADVHYDDGHFGNVVGTAEARGGTLKVDTFVGHNFWVTMYGVRESLVDPETDEQYFFTVQLNNDNGDDQQEDEEKVLFHIPETAAPSKTLCKDRYPKKCISEARRGECARNPGWMIVNCCKSCDDLEGYGKFIDSKVRCDPERLNATIPAWKSGDLEDIFSRWATHKEYERYEPRVVSSPNREMYGGEYEGPWVMTFDNFLDDYEIEQLLKGAEYGNGFQRSTDQGNIIGDSGEMVKVTSKSRTSSNAWCRDECESLEGVKRVTKRIEDVTGIPQNNYESFQILEYQPGQFYKRHHDSSGRKDKATGHRILTFFLYLNDVEEGGETGFTDLDISIKPKKGRALVWPSVLNEDPDSSDYRMFHEAKEVIKGTKYAANHWIHQYDFKNANLWGCNGSFN